MADWHRGSLAVGEQRGMDLAALGPLTAVKSFAEVEGRPWVAVELTVFSEDQLLGGEDPGSRAGTGWGTVKQWARLTKGFPCEKRTALRNLRAGRSMQADS